jgi:hypothetical protein
MRHIDASRKGRRLASRSFRRPSKWISTQCSSQVSRQGGLTVTLRSYLVALATFFSLLFPALATGANNAPAPRASGSASSTSSHTAASANFVVSAPERELAEAVLKRAEALRETLAQRWLREELPSGVGPTVIRVKLSSAEDKGLSWVADNEARLSHLMWLTTSRELAVGSTLAHEMTHVVLATRYPGAVPAFANEGAACEQDDPERVAMRKRIVEWWAQTGNWPHVGELFEAKQIDPADAARYALACSVTEFLLTRGDRAKFIDFAVAGPVRGWPTAVREFYGFNNLMTLQTAWRDWAVESL